MTTILEFVVLFAAILLGIRFGGIALGFWGGVGLFVLSVVFGVMPTSPPVDRDAHHFGCLHVCFLHGSGGWLGYYGAYCG